MPAIPESLDELQLHQLVTLTGALHKLCIRRAGKITGPERDEICLLVLIILGAAKKKRDEGATDVI